MSKTKGEDRQALEDQAREAVADAKESHEEAVADARETYDEALADAKQSFDEALADAKQTYEEALSDAKQAYDEARADAKQSHDEALADAQQSYEEALADARSDQPLATRTDHQPAAISARIEPRSEPAWRRTIKAALPVLGNVLVLAGLVGLPIQWGLWIEPTSHTSSHESTITQTEGAAAAFNKELWSGAKPCAVKGKNYSDVRRCSLLGVRLGMSLDEAKRKIKDSALFLDEPLFIKGCHGTNKKCIGYLLDRRAGLTLSVDFAPASDEEASALVASQIMLWFGPGAIPYFDPEAMRPIFVRLIGEPDRSTDTFDAWGDLHGVPNILDFSTDAQTFVITLTSGRTSETSLSMNDAQLMREARR